MRIIKICFSRSIIVSLLFMAAVCQNSAAQSYQARYAEFGYLNSGTGVLTFNSTEWLYEMNYSQEIKVSSNDVYISEDDEIQGRYNTKLFNYYSLNSKEYYWELMAVTEKVIVKDSLEEINWEILNDSTKEIGNLHCIKAKGKLGGWDVEAWFTIDVPISCGPWRFWGLPGLIIAAYSLDGDIDIQLTSLKNSENGPVLPDISGIKIIKKIEYRALTESNAKKLARMISSMQDRDASVDVDIKVKDADKCF